MRATPARWLAAVCLAALAAAPADAGWLSVRNDTTKPVLVQEVPDGILRRGKVVRLLPGEVYREFHARPGCRTVDVFELARPMKPVLRAKVQWPAGGDVTFKLTVAPDPKTKQDLWAVADAAPPPAAVAAKPPAAGPVVPVKAETPKDQKPAPKP